MSQALRVSHVGFSDESYWNVGRYRSLGLVTTSVDLHASLENELLCLLEKSEVREFKWKSWMVPRKGSRLLRCASLR
jgi:hypothetical protein